MPHATTLNKKQEFIIQVVLLLAKKYNFRTCNKHCGLELLAGDGFSLDLEARDSIHFRFVVDIIKDKLNHERKVMLVDTVKHHFDHFETTDPDEAFAILITNERKELREELMESIASYFMYNLELYVF